MNKQFIYEVMIQLEVDETEEITHTLVRGLSQTVGDALRDRLGIVNACVVGNRITELDEGARDE